MRLLFCPCQKLIRQFSLLEAPGTKFTKEPPGTVFASLSSNAIFSWEFSFGTTQDWRNFEKIVWGKTDADQIQNKYITILKNGITAVNPSLSDSFQSRLNWTGNISQNGCQMQFILKNVTKLDETRTYGCTAFVFGQDYRSGPIKLAVVSEYEYSTFNPDNLVLSSILTKS